MWVMCLSVELEVLTTTPKRHYSSSISWSTDSGEYEIAQIRICTHAEHSFPASCALLVRAGRGVPGEELGWSAELRLTWAGELLNTRSASTFCPWGSCCLSLPQAHRKSKCGFGLPHLSLSEPQILLLPNPLRTFPVKVDLTHPSPPGE